MQNRKITDLFWTTYQVVFQRMHDHTDRYHNLCTIRVPVYSADIKKRIIKIMNLQLEDNQKARIQDSNGKYHYKEDHNSDKRINSQELFLLESLGSVVEE